MARTRNTARKATGGSAIRVSIGAIKGDGVGTDGDCAQTAPAETTCHSVATDDATQRHMAVTYGPATIVNVSASTVAVSLCSRPMELSVRSSLLSHPTLVIHLRLRSIPAGGPMDMVAEILKPYFPNGGFHFTDLPFDIGTKAKLNSYKRQVSRLVTKLHSVTFKNVMVAFTDHSDNSRGDLFIGKTTGKEDQACVLSECLDILLSPFGDILHGGLFVLFACGHRFSSTIAFDAERLQVVLTSNLILGIVDRTFIQGYPVRMAMPEALGESSRLGYHSSVYLLTLACTNSALELTVTKYTWSHRDIRPWGNPLPSQCPQCGCIQVQWERTALPHDATATHGFSCANKDCGKLDGKGPKMFKFARPLDIKLLDQGRRWNSAWLEIGMGMREFPMWVASQLE
ncbi:hypothetical protein EDD15DRAFT_2204730 [Pisolithus albus]|nr:hypothetical protein EDD15DRAFT_2204730 [Pisolithus albus]